MSHFDTGRNILQAWILYWGPSGSGKTTSLASLRRLLDPEEGSHLYSLAAEDKSTLLFDLLPVEEFRFGHCRVHARVFAVPGGDERQAARVALLREADAILFVADARHAAAEKNVASWRELEETLSARGVQRADVPVVCALNKQDQADTVTNGELRTQLGVDELPIYETVATDGRGVFESFSETFRLMLDLLARRHGIAGADPRGAIPARLLPQLVRGAKPSFRSVAQDRHMLMQVPNVPEAEQAIAAQIALAEAHISVDAANHMLNGRNQELTAVNRVARSILSAMEADNLLVVMLNSTADHLNASHATCVLFDPTNRGTLRTHVLGFGKPPALGLQGEAAKKFFELIRTSDGPVPLGDKHNLDLLEAVKQVDRRITRAMFQPIKANDNKPAGWIGIYGTADEPQLHTKALLFLSSISRLAALGLEKIALLDKVQRFGASQEEEVRERNSQLEMANAKIRALNRGLEARVKERTQALEEANRQLKEQGAGSIHAARLTGMGEVAASFAQQVKRPVTDLISNLELMRDGLDELRARVASVAPRSADGLGAIDEFDDLLAESIQSSDHVSGILSSLKRLGAEGDAKTFSLNSVVADAATLMEERVRKHADFDLSLGSLPEIEGDERELQHVILALITNAAEAIEGQKRDERGRISVATFATGEKITLTVKDDGCGIGEALLMRIFEPFTTTKTDEASAGLGLHGAYKAAERHGGTVRVRSKPGEGTTVTMVLPVASAVSAGAADVAGEER